MRFPATRHLLHGAGVEGVKIEGDAELILPPVVQPVVRLGQPIASVLFNQEDTSHWDTLYVNSVGIGGGAIAGGNEFNRGTWLIQGNVSYSFIGTTNGANLTSLQLLDQQANAITIARFASINGSQLVIPLDWEVSFNTDAWLFQISYPATVAGDFLRAGYALKFTRIL